MTPEGFDRLREVLLSAMAAPETERSELLDRLCAGDAEIRKEAEELLGQTGARSSPIASTAGAYLLLDRDGGTSGLRTGPGAEGPAPARPAIPEELAPSWIGNYRVLGVAGRGGMATVYRAEQITPFHREVAVKVLHQRGPEEGRFLARFENERQALALMDHRNIAKVFDAGEDEEGRPFLVMELVRGIPINEFCERRSLSAHSRIRLFLEVCLAVQHAHQKGIVHRDIKPSNILVGEEDGVPRVIDFGIAKALEGGTAADLTREGLMIGTLEYMSPEQVAGGAHRVDTRTDVYSLGVVLYVLVTGHLPYETEGKAVWEIGKLIATTPPVPPARRATRGAGVDGDLSTILLHALEKNLDDRYPTAAALADDLDRYLHRLPILAHPPSALYQIRKLIARNRLPAAMSGAMLLLLVVFAVTMSILFDAQRRERHRAETEARKASRINSFLNSMLSSVNPTIGQKDVTVRAVLDRAAGDVDSRLAEEPEVAAAVGRSIGNSYYGLGLHDSAEPHLRRAVEFWSTRGDDPDELIGATIDLCNNMMRQGRHGEVEPILDEVLRRHDAYLRSHGDLGAGVLYCLGMAQMGQEKLEDAERSCRAALDLIIAQEGIADSSVVPSFIGGLSVVLERQGRYAEAEPLVREALRMRRQILRPDHPSLAFSLHDLGFLLRRQGKLAQADSFYQEALSIRQRIYGDDHPETAWTYYNLAHLRLAEGRLAEAESLAWRSQRIDAHFHGAESDELGSTYLLLADIHLSRNSAKEAERLSRIALRSIQSAANPRPAQIGRAWERLGRSLALQRRYQEAESAFREGIAATRQAPMASQGVLADLTDRLRELLSAHGRSSRTDSATRESPPASHPAGSGTAP